MNTNGEVVLDKEQFKKDMTVPFISVEKKTMQQLMYLLKPFLLKIIKFNPVTSDESDDLHKDVLLDPQKVKEINDLGEELMKKLQERNPNAIKLKEKTIQLTYENMSTETVLKTLIPEEAGPFSSWSTIGHIAHVNLRDNHLAYKKIIGQVLLDKNRPNIKLVVNKVNGIESEFRNFEMEVLASDSNDVSTVVQVSQSGCSFKFDFSKVYWNPRLDTEHERILIKLRNGMDVLYDVFAGVGPFSIPASKKRCKCLANDLNPESFKWIKENEKINKVSECHSSFNLDGRDFIKTVVKEDLIQEWKAFSEGKETAVKNFHVVMNLPSLATQFLDSFVGLMTQEEEVIRSLKQFKLPIVHCYCFVKGSDKEENRKRAIQSTESVLQTDLSSFIEEVTFVRKVSPNKDMFRVSFILPEDVVFAKKHKKLKVEDSNST